MLQSDKSLAGAVYREILRMIVTLEIAPGTRLQERSLAEQLRMSRTPIREALNRLAQESWVRINARRNIQVKGLEIKDVRNLFAVRQTLELRGLDYLFDNRMTQGAAQAMREALNSMRQRDLNDYQFNRADLQFHAIMSLADNNRYFAEFWKRLMLENARMGLVAFAFFNRNTDRICREHAQILKAFEKGARKKAREALVAHLDGVMDAIILPLEREEGGQQVEDDMLKAVAESGMAKARKRQNP